MTVTRERERETGVRGDLLRRLRELHRLRLDPRAGSVFGDAAAELERLGEVAALAAQLLAGGGGGCRLERGGTCRACHVGHPCAAARLRELLG